MANRANSFSFQFLQTFGTFISGHSTFRQNVRMASLMSQLISNQRWAEFGWFVSLAEQYPDVLLSMSKSDRDALLEQSTNAKLSFPNQDIPTSPLSVLEKLLSWLFGIKSFKLRAEPKIWQENRWFSLGKNWLQIYVLIIKLVTYGLETAGQDARKHLQILVDSGLVAWSKSAAIQIKAQQEKGSLRVELWSQS